MDTNIQAIIMSFREGLEAFLIIGILLKYLDKSSCSYFKKYVWLGVIIGIITSISLGLVLMVVSEYLGGLSTTVKLWESLASFIAVILVSTFIIWMINHGNQIKTEIENNISRNITINGVLFLSILMITREGAEIVVFSFAGKYELMPVVIGLSMAVMFATLINFSLIKVNLKTIFVITLAYLIIQAGYLLGYSIHEGLSAAKNLGWINSDHQLLYKLFDLSGTLLNHKQGVIGLPLNIALGWYSKPEWLQFIIQYGFTASIFTYWYKKTKSIHP